MDELEFRRQAYADPYSDDPAFIDAMNQEASRKAFVEELQLMDQKMASAMKVDPPEDLAERILLQQNLTQFQSSKRHHRLQLAAAAAVAFAIGLSFTLIRQPMDIGDHALAHVAHEAGFADRVDEQVSLDALNVKLASFGGKLTHSSGHIYYANYCDFDGVRSLHTIIDTPQGRMTVFFIPKEQSQKMVDKFANDAYKGKAFDMPQLQVAVVGGKLQKLEPVIKEIKDSLIAI
ncbi:DUF3379 family protein [Ferrimonas aestuarii]|uniref:DUF3379 domain-containing protein n=1 Tax=Ferrimonas aestuarii TaxID=2569539 RepID=A0A4U1BNM4_9GAMM|nr:DUF3379 family protein [Ferrimonas aestuarii]TKB55533.1 DUF3379 domain-containing protein [Ferrimonas aestuarii]